MGAIRGIYNYNALGSQREKEKGTLYFPASHFDYQTGNLPYAGFFLLAFLLNYSAFLLCVP